MWMGQRNPAPPTGWYPIKSWDVKIIYQIYQRNLQDFAGPSTVTAALEVTCWRLFDVLGTVHHSIAVGRSMAGTMLWSILMVNNH